MTEPTRRIVTGHAADGRSIVISDGAIPHVRQVRGARFDEVWGTSAASEPLRPAPSGEPTSQAGTLAAARGGSTIRVIHFLPAAQGGARSPMHRTRTIDYGIMLSGEMVMILTDSEVVLRPGDVVVQRGTDHAWENRSEQVATMAFVLIDADFAPELAAILTGELTA